MTTRQPCTSSLCTLLVLFGLGSVSTAPPASAGGCGHRGISSHAGHGHHGALRSHRSHGVRPHGVRPHGVVHHGFKSSGAFRGFGGFRSYGGFTHRSYPSYRYVPYVPYYVTSGVSPYPTAYAPVADTSVYATPGSVYDPAFQRGVAAQPLDDYTLAPPAAGQQQPIYIIVQPAAGQQPAPAPPEVSDPAPPRYERPIAVSGGEAGQVFLSVQPANAAVYLDDDLLGTGDALATGKEPLVLDSGVHVLEVVHPRYPTQRLVFGMPSAGRLRIEFDLEGDRRGRKARVEPLDP